MQRCNEAYLLETLPLGEADLILTLLMEGEGIVRGVARAARRSRRRFGGSLEPMSRVVVRWSRKEGGDLQRLESLELAKSFSRMQADPATQAACAVLAEITRMVSRENDDDPRVYRLLGAVLSALEGGLDRWAAVHYFEIWMLRLHGLLPDIHNCGVCGKPWGHGELFVSRGGDVLLCRRCVSSAGTERRSLTAGEKRFLEAALVRPPEEMSDLAGAVGPGGAFDWLLRGAIEGFSERPLKTYRHLAALTAAAG